MVKKKTTNKCNSDIMGIFLITLGILMLIGIFSTPASGILGKEIKKLLITLLGIGSYIFPFLIIFIGACYIVKKGKINFGKRFYGILLFIISSLLALLMVNINKYYINKDFAGGFRNIYTSKTIMHGGFLSYVIDVPLYNLFGSMGSYVIFVSLYIISFVLITEISLSDIISVFKSTKKVNDETTSVPDKNTKCIVEANSIGTNSEKEEYVKGIKNKIKIFDFLKSPSNDNDISENKNINVDSFMDNNIKNTNETEEDNEKNDISKELEEKMNESTQKESVMDYKYPTSQLLNSNNLSKLNKEDKKELLNNANKLEETLNSFGVNAKVIQVTKGPSVTRFELQPNAGVKVSKIVSLADDIALNLASSGVRIEAPIPGKSAVGIEVPNKELAPVFIKEVIESDAFVSSKYNLAFCLGKDIGGNCMVSDLTKMPHLLIAGATGSGKSVCINTLIISLLYKYSPQDVRLLLIDPKVVELNVYNGIPHLLIPVVTEPKKAAGALNWAVTEMTRRYKLFAQNNVRNIESYNDLIQKGKIDEKLPLIVIIIDELADLMMVCPNDIEDYIGRLAQMARAAGMHLVIATQRPSVDVITGVIKANIPSRISFAVSSQIDSRTILDMGGAEKLLGKGDMLFYPVGESKPLRIQGAFISEEEVENVVDYIKKASEEPEYDDQILEKISTDNSLSNSNEEKPDELLEEAIRIVVEEKQASVSLLQRRLRVGYNRAARMIDELEAKEIISPKDGSKPRQVLVTKDQI